MFEYNGKQYSLQQLQKGATDQGLEFDDYLQRMQKLGMVEVDSIAPVDTSLVDYDLEKESKKYGESWGEAIGRTGLNLFSGATDFVDATKRTAIDLIIGDVDQNAKDAVVKSLEKQDGLMQMFGAGLKGTDEKDIFEQGIDYFGLNERIDADQSITQDLFGKNTNYARGGARIIEAGLESIPSFAAAYIGAPAMVGYAAILAGDKFQEEYEKNPQESVKRLYFNAVGSGSIEMGFEVFTRGLMKKAGLLSKGGNIKAAKEVLRGGATSIIKNIGYGFGAEGLSESATELTNDLFDSLSRDFGGLGKELPSWDKVKYKYGDAFIIGGFIGGGISSFGEVSQRGEGAEQRATLLLMEEDNKNKIFSLGEEISKLQKDHTKADETGKVIIEEEMNNKAKEIQKIYDSTKLGLDNLNSSDLKKYTENIVEINSLKQDIKRNADNESIKNINQEKISNLLTTNKGLLGEAIQKGKEIQEGQLQESIKFAEEKGKEIGKKVKIVKDNESAQKEAELLGYKGEVTDTDGFIMGDNIIINEAVARESGAISVGSHELLHGIIGNSFGKLETKDKVKLGKSFMSVLTSKQEAAVRKRLKDSYGLEGDAVFQSEEMFTAFSDAIIKKEISFNENVFSKIGSSIQETLRKLSEAGYIGKESFLYRKEFSNGRQVYNFLKDYTKNVQKGKISERAEKFAKVDPETTTLKKSVSPLEAINELIPDNVKTQQDYYKLLDDPRVTNRVFDGRKLAPVIEAYIRSRSTSPEMANENIQAVKDRLVNFDPAAERADGSLVGPEGFGEFIFANTRFGKLVAAKKLAVEGEKRKRTTSIDDPDVTDIPDDTPTPTKKVEDKTKKTVVSSKLGVKNKVDKAVKKQLPKLDVENLTFKKIKNLVPEITGELFGISPTKLKTLANITKPELQKAQMYISKNADLLLAMLPKGTTISGTSTGVPNTLLAAFYTKTAKAKLAKTGSRAGLPIQIKNKNITKKQFLEVFGIIDGVPVRTDRNTSARVLALANLTGKMMTNQAVRQNLELLGNSEQTIKNIREGASNIMFSKSNKIVKKHNLPDLNINDPKNGIENYNTFLDKMTLLSTFLPDRFIRRVDLYNFGISNQSVRLYAREQTKELNDTFLMGKHPDRVYQRPDTALGKRMKDITKAKVEKYNKTGSSNFNDMVNGIQKAIEANPNDKELHTAIFMYLSSAVNDTSHPMRAGAEYVGGDITNTGGILYEHALQNANTRDEILDAILDNKKDFKKTMKSIKKNYKLIAMSIADAATVDSTTYIDENGKAVKFKNGMGLINGKPWDLFKDNWFDRYFNLVINSIDPKKYKVFKNGKTFADEYGVTKSGKVNFSKSINKTKTLDNAIKMSRSVFKKNFDLRQAQKQKGKEFVESILKKPKGITVLDFDDTLATTESLVKYTAADGTTGTLNAEEYASTYEDLLDQGFTFDFSDFNKVVKGKLAPLFNKAIKLQGKFGPENMFVLTARPPAAQKAIFDFLKANGLNIPLKNITGLGNSTAEAKALWVADKVGEGYNDFYFADDALQNTQAVQNMLDQFDVKSKVQQAKVKFSKNINNDFNNILEEVTGIDSAKRFSDTKARKRGESKGKFRFFIPPSHEDFVGLLYNFMGKGKKGNEHRSFFEQALVRPLNRAYREIDTAKQAIANDYKSLNKQFPDVKEKLIKNTPDGDFTFQDAIRVYLWNKHGYNIPGLSKTDQQNLVDIVMNDSELQTYAETLNTISKQEAYVDPGPNWETGNIRIDLVDATGRVGRKQYFTEFNENAEVLFSPENLNKIEAAYGKDFREALEDMLHRIKTGVNRSKGASAKPNMFMNWLNASVSGVMFFNTRSALLQQMSNVNFLNFADNNIYAAGKAFANQPQYWKDFAMIFNSDMLKQRRGGLQTDINGAELAEAIKKARPDNVFDQVSIIVGKALRLGFLPTQIGDNIAIATGGAAFYRNRVNKYIKDGLSKKEAEDKAFIDLQDITNATQQSARPDMTSAQQAAWVGKLILNFLNTPSQYNRIIKKAGSDIINRRITPPNTTQMQSDMSNMSRILYYGAAQNLIFYGLQTALFAVMFGLEDDDEEKRAEQILKKKERVINGAIDTILRGSGIYGVAVSTLKNMIIKFAEQREKGYNKDESAVIMELANFSPVVGIKLRKIVNAEKTLNYNKKIIDEMETFDIDNPQWSAVTNYVEAITTAPANRIYQKTINLRNASDNQYTAFQRALFFSGYTTWSLNLGDTQKMKDIKEKVKGKKKKKKRVLGKGLGKSL